MSYLNIAQVNFRERPINEHYSFPRPEMVDLYKVYKNPSQAKCIAWVNLIQWFNRWSEYHADGLVITKHSCQFFTATGIITLNKTRYMVQFTGRNAYIHKTGWTIKERDIYA